ncbi:hypothetical protein CS369_13035 [Candidatus Symbiopectobacterium sp. 'North America']|uniref:DUF2501 domain-containing protein n=1 Tax=Candidatus Symbiopectobacterium sp. 'North America' TaxID=2794574 RepID=UPI0018C8F423|nr:DUF2501 domain-containing protein [Candidatus Symbiopectobacterium sp. 'North America']MBG6245470.1 hypothetical protein [Candidatus Symbiopectobacterium sp. 'North America']
MNLINRTLYCTVFSSLLMTGNLQAANWQDTLSSGASQLGQNGSSTTNLAGLLGGGTQALSAGSMGNAAGILQYCIKQKLVSATNTENIKDKLLDKLGLNSTEKQKQTDYTQGMAGMLQTKDGQALNLNNIGSTPLAEKVKTKACDLVLKQGMAFLS